MRVSNRLRRSMTATAAVVMAVTGVVAGAPQASADPTSGVNIGGEEQFDTDVFMDSLCGDISTEDKSFVFNIHSGEIVNPSDAYGKQPYYNLAGGQARSTFYRGPIGFHYALNPGWEFFKGNCEFPESSSWTWYDSERRTSDDTVTNCSSGTATLAVNESYSTTRTFTKTVGVNMKVAAKVADIFSAEIGGSFSYSWAISHTHTLGRTVAISVPPGRQGWISARPLKRTVRVNPVFHVTFYTWSDGQAEFGPTVYNWRGRGYDHIWSHGFYADGSADVVNADGTPAMDFVTRDKSGRC